MMTVICYCKSGSEKGCLSSHYLAYCCSEFVLFNWNINSTGKKDDDILYIISISFRNYFLYVSVWLHCMFVYQERASDALKLELLAVISHHLCCGN